MVTFRLLLLDDDVEMGALLHEALKDDCPQVDYVQQGADAYSLFRPGRYDAALVDLGLPDMAGLDVIRWVRSQDRAVFIVVISGRSLPPDKIEAFESGADAYFVKPFDPNELLARLRSLKRRSAVAGSSTLPEGGLRFDVTKRQVLKFETPIRLTSQEYFVLKPFIEGIYDWTGPQVSAHLTMLGGMMDASEFKTCMAALRRKLDSSIITIGDP